jgi:hypothetical protein
MPSRGASAEWEWGWIDARKYDKMDVVNGAERDAVDKLE